MDRPVRHGQAQERHVTWRGPTVAGGCDPPWVVTTLQGTKAIEGDVPFMVSDHSQ